MAAASSTTPTVSPSVSPTPSVNEFLYKPYRRSPNKTTKRKKHLFLQAGLVATASPRVKAVFEVVKALGEEAPLKDTVILPPDETGKLNEFISNNTVPKGLGFCAPRTSTNQGVAGQYATTSSLKPLNILITARRQRENLNSTQAFVLITPPRFEGEEGMKIDLLCVKTAPEIDNVGAYLVSFVFLLCRRLGITKIKLSAVSDRVGYYLRLGFHIVSVELLTHMEMEVPPIDAGNLLFEENENTGFVEHYPAVFVEESGGSTAAASAYFEEEPEESGIGIDNVFGGTGPIASNRIAAEKENMSAFTRRRKQRRRRTRRAVRA